MSEQHDKIKELCWDISNTYWEPDDVIAAILAAFDRAERVVDAARTIAQALYVEPERIHEDLSRATVDAASALADALAAYDAGDDQ